MSGEQAGQPATYITINIESKNEKAKDRKKMKQIKKKKKAMQPLLTMFNNIQPCSSQKRNADAK